MEAGRLTRRNATLKGALIKVTEAWQEYAEGMRDCFTDGNGNYDDDDDREFIEGLLLILAECRAALEPTP